MGYRVQLLQSWDAPRHMGFLFPPVSLAAIEGFNHFVVGYMLVISYLIFILKIRAGVVRFFSFEEIGAAAQLTILKGLNLSITTGLPLPVGRCNPWKRKQPDLAILTLKGSNFMYMEFNSFRVGMHQGIWIFFYHQFHWWLLRGLTTSWLDWLFLQSRVRRSRI
ncbi:hypothetical protein [Algoriphagus ornithinivorans]|nr:hypothetical protein [Algoriphagus ornithinivorans]